MQYILNVVLVIVSVVLYLALFGLNSANKRLKNELNETFELLRKQKLEHLKESYKRAKEVETFNGSTDETNLTDAPNGSRVLDQAICYYPKFRRLRTND